MKDFEAASFEFTDSIFTATRNKKISLKKRNIPNGINIRHFITNLKHYLQKC